MKFAIVINSHIQRGGGSIHATVFIHNDLNCCWSAAIVIEESLGGLRTVVWNPASENKTQATELDMKMWIATKLTELSTDDDGNSQVTGLPESVKS